MKTFNNTQFIKDTFTRLPYNIEWAETGAAAGIGGLAASAVSVALELVKERKKRNWWKPLYWGLAGAAAGAGGSLIHQNVLENISAKYADKINDVYKDVYPKIDKEHPGKTYTIYFHGMNEGQTDLKDKEVVSTDTDEAVTMPGYYAKYLDNWMKQLPPEAKVNVIGHSYGGGSLHNALKHVSRRVNNAILVDPINTFINSRIKTAKNKVIDNLKVIGPLAMTGKTRGNQIIKFYMNWLIGQALKAYDDKYLLLRGDDHSMLNSKFRYTKDNDLKDIVNHLHQVDQTPDSADSYYFA